MHRLFPAAAALIALSSPVHAAGSFSFMIGGHRIQIAAPNHCGYGPCVSVSPRTTHKRSRPDDGDRQVVTSSVTPASAAPAASKPAAPPALCMAPVAPLRPPAPQAQQVAPLPVQPPQIQPVQPTPVPPPVTTAAITPPPPPLPESPAPLPPASPPQEIVPPVEVAPQVAAQVSNDAPKIAKVLHQVEEEPADTPLGDWHAEGQKGVVRIEPCGRSLCGYTVDAATNAKGETVLVDMKSKSASKWFGSIYSRDSGNTYYGTITLKGPDSLKVEACALGHFFCTGTLWKRADSKPKKLISDRDAPQEPRT